MGVRNPPFRGSPNFIKREKNVARVRAKAYRFSYPDPPPPALQTAPVINASYYLEDPILTFIQEH